MKIKMALISLLMIIGASAKAEVWVCQTKENWLIEKYDTKFLMIDTARMQGQLGNSKNWRKKYPLQTKKIAIGTKYFWKEIMPNGYPYTFSVRVKNSGSADVTLINRREYARALQMECKST